MSKITFRADDDLIQRLEEFDASKSEVMREALRSYLDGADATEAAAGADVSDTAPDPESIDGLIADRVDSIIADRLDDAFPPRQPQDVNVNIAIEGESGAVSDETVESGDRTTPSPDGSSAGVSHEPPARKTDEGSRESPDSGQRKTCAQCGENLSGDHVYCPNCGEKASHRVFCDCGDEIRSDWGFCPSCGRRTPAADVLDQQ